ncbi:MAG TPA: GNAT family N-acetyltransferase [Gemmatimonadaceae bacterium]|nr:GNAT family N-acetyltransferase [Gemmatimonadaceae bacterium]
MNSDIDILLLGPSDAAVLDRLAPGVFDHAVQPHWRATFLADPRHHLVVARSDGIVVGMASAVDYVHPDKAPQLWINEVGVSPAYRRRGIGRRLVERLVELATELGCTEVWVLTDTGNAAANRLYAAAGAEVPPAASLMYTIPIRRSD